MGTPFQHTNIALVLHQKGLGLDPDNAIWRRHPNGGCSPPWSQTSKQRFNDGDAPGAINSIVGTAIGDAPDGGFHALVCVFSRVDDMRGPEFLGKVELLINHVNGDELPDLEVGGGHQGGNSNAPHAKDDDRLGLVWLQDVEQGAGAGLEPAAQGRVVGERLGIRALDDAPLGDDGHARKGGLAETLAAHGGSVGEPGRRGAVRHANGAGVDRGVDVAAGRVVGKTLLALAADVKRQKHVVSDLQGLILDVAAKRSDDAGALVAKDGGILGAGNLGILEQDILVGIR